MHPNPGFAWTDRDEMLAFLSEVSFSTLFIAAQERPRIAHAPVAVFGRDRLRFHLSRRNAAAGAAEGTRVLLSCTGPDAYVSPDWYGSDDQVPTWNYVVVECEGPIRRLHDGELVELLDVLSAEREARLAPKKAWTRAKMAPGRFEAMLKAIVGFELAITELRGTRKLGQNKPAAERAGAIDGLRAAGFEQMAGLMEKSA
jgi:transcriptional regulator